MLNGRPELVLAPQNTNQSTALNEFAYLRSMPNHFRAVDRIVPFDYSSTVAHLGPVSVQLLVAKRIGAG